MDNLHKFFVVVENPDDKDQVHQGLQSEIGSEFIPERPVECADSIPGSEHNGLFFLTHEEADQLKNDPRVRDVHRIPEEIGVSLVSHGSRTGVFDKTTSVNSSMRNWALNRCINFINNFGGANSTSTPYTYSLDGTGVDVIIMDTGVEPGHPEFAVNADGTGGSRVVNFDWTVYGNLSSPVGGFNGDCDGHGSNVASIIAGNTCGWAPKASIYTLRVVSDGTNGPYYSIYDNRQLGILNEFSAWQSIRAFHLAKPVTSTGYRRPTIVNCSYGYSRSYPATGMTSITYRGNTVSATTTTGAGGTLYGTIGRPNGGTGVHGYRYSAEEANIQSCILAGVIVIGSAGNDYHKIDVSTGTDYNNYYSGASIGSWYYHRGSSPGSSDGVICVGAISVTTPEHKNNFSSTGPRVDVYAPGNSILGSWKSASYTAAIQDPRNTAYYLDKVTGTSQSAPQVTGVVALLLQARPWMTNTDVLKFVQAVSAKNLLDETYYGQSGTYTNFASLQGSGNRYLYWPFNQSNPMTIG